MSIAATDLVFKGNVEMWGACSEDGWVCGFGVFCCLNRGFSRISRITRILKVFLFVVAQFIAPFSESRISQMTWIISCLNRGFARMTRMTRIGTL